jgi:hypothetical protein
MVDFDLSYLRLEFQHHTCFTALAWAATKTSLGFFYCLFQSESFLKEFKI